ncbi:hypothetical protein [Kribbella sp. NBC_00889]|nr:hypothetical protein OG817_08875 [Kribbella sp. NBC_00889]
MSIPAVIAGFASAEFGVRSTAIVYSIGLIALCALTLLIQRLRRHRTATD